jgi:muramidase (phage lysozyme)
LPPSNYNGGAVFTLDEINKSNDTYTVSEATTYITTVNAADNTVVTSLPNKEELYSKYTEAEQIEEASNHPNTVVPKANNDGLNTVIIIAGAFALIAFLVLVLS